MMFKIIWIAAPSKKKRVHVYEYMLVIPEFEGEISTNSLYLFPDRQAEKLDPHFFRDVWRRQLGLKRVKGER